QERRAFEGWRFGLDEHSSRYGSDRRARGLSRTGLLDWAQRQHGGNSKVWGVGQYRLSQMACSQFSGVRAYGADGAYGRTGVRTIVADSMAWACGARFVLVHPRPPPLAGGHKAS